MGKQITMAEAIAKAEKVSAPNAAISVTRFTLSAAGKAALSGKTYTYQIKSSDKGGGASTRKK